uniref:Uncharacterized protein n=1 Tax=Anguilla anguilla TaxID=7936 RepID=A0A0E9VLI6_ANGAN
MAEHTEASCYKTRIPKLQNTIRARIKNKIMKNIQSKI